jgi:hypothetical protein
MFGTDQRITSGPAVTLAASRWRQSSKRKQAEYMAAPERLAKRQIPLALRAPSIHGPSVWTGRALQAENDDLEKVGLALLYPAY